MKIEGSGRPKNMWIRIRIRNTGKNSPAMKQKEEDSEGHAEDGDGEAGVGDVRQPDIVRALPEAKFKVPDWGIKSTLA
jgi:hypothetical protein